MIVKLNVCLDLRTHTQTHTHTETHYCYQDLTCEGKSVFMLLQYVLFLVQMCTACRQPRLIAVMYWMHRRTPTAAPCMDWLISMLLLGWFSMNLHNLS